MNSASPAKPPSSRKDLQVIHVTGDSPELTDALITELATQFRFIFSNPPYGQFLFYPSQAQPITPQQALHSKQIYVDLKTLDQFQLKDFPAHPQTEEKAQRWIDPEKTKQILSDKLKLNSFLTLLKQSEHIVGACFGYQSSLRESFENEEWHNPFHYSQVENPQYFRSFDNFLSKLQKTVSSHKELDQQLHAQTPVFCQSFIFLQPQLQGQRRGYWLAKVFLEQIPAKFNTLLCLSEMIVGTGIYNKAEQAGIIPVPGILSADTAPQTGQNILMINTLQKYIQAANPLTSSPST